METVLTPSIPGECGWDQSVWVFLRAIECDRSLTRKLFCFLKSSSPEGARRFETPCSHPLRLTPFDFGNELIAMPSLKKKCSNSWALGSHVLSFLRNSIWVHTLQRHSVLEGKYFLTSRPLTPRSKGRVWTSLLLCQFNNSLIKVKKKTTTFFAYLLYGEN